jgi:hypothetical protein
VAYGSYTQQKASFEEQKQQFRLTQSEQVVVTLNPHAEGPFRFTNIKLAGTEVVQFPWKLQIANTGNQKLSIINYQISGREEPGSTLYSGMDGGIFSEQGEPVRFPLILETGDSRALVAMIGVRVSGAVTDVLSSLDPAARNTSAATMALGKRGLDLYGNSVEFEEYGGGTYTLSVAPENQRAPRFWFVATTGRGNPFAASASFYDRPH